jgi:hypothetical protein
LLNFPQKINFSKFPPANKIQQNFPSKKEFQKIPKTKMKFPFSPFQNKFKKLAKKKKNLGKKSPPNLCPPENTKFFN